MPFSLRRPPIGIQDFEYNNNFSILPVKLSLVDDMSLGVKLINKEMNEKKASLEPVGVAKSTDLLLSLPEFLRSYLLNDILSKISLGMSNVPGAKKPLVITGKKAKSSSFVMPVGKTISASVSLMSHYDTVTVGFSLD